jgi:hypothetical protein
MDTHQVLELLLARMDADREEWKTDEEIRSNQAKLLATMEANWAKAETHHKDFPARIDARWNAWWEIMNANHDEMLACQEKTEFHLEEKQLTSADTKPEAAEERQVPEENATVMPVEEPKKKRRRDRRLAAECRRHKQKISTLESCGPPKELGVARRRTTRRVKVARKAPIDRMYRRAKVARHKENTVRRNRIRNNVARTTLKGRRLQVEPEGSIGVKAASWE